MNGPGQDRPDSGSRSAEQRLARALEEAEGMAARGERDARSLAARCSIDPDTARRLLAGALAFEGALAPDLDPTESGGTGGTRAAGAASAPPELPEDYEVRAEIGRGGMGVVYRAHQRSLERDVAVKVLMPGELRFASALDRFRLEAKSLARLRHRHIVAIHEIGEAGGNLFYSMDLIEGGSLADLLKEGPLSAARTVRILRHVTAAIAYTHGAGVVHRDLKPANVLLDPAGEAYVADFGLALDVAWDRGLTSTGHLLGTPDYMSPEQARGDREHVGEASDIHALGALLYACLTGEAPFAGLPLADKIHRVVYDLPTPPRRRNPSVPLDLETICLKAMAKRPEDRYATARAMLEDLERFEEGRSIRARRPTPLQLAQRLARRHARELAVGAGVALAAVGLAWVTLVESGERAFERRLEDVRRMLVAGEPRAARLMLDEATASGAPDLSRDAQLLFDHVSAACDLERGNALVREGRAEDARAVFERAASTLEVGVARARYSRADGWPAVRFEMLADLAIAQVQLGDTDAALDTLARFHGALVHEPWTDRLLEWMAPRLADPAAAGHAAAVLIVSGAIDWSTPGSFGDWLARWPDLAPDMLEAMLVSLDDLPSARAGFVEAGLVRRGTLASPALRRVVARVSNRAVTLADRLEERLAALAADEARPDPLRARVANVLVNLADLPFRLAGDSAQDMQLVGRALEAWSATHAVPDRRAALAGWLSTASLEGVARSDADVWRARWFGAAKVEIESGSDVPVQLERFATLGEPEARRVHRALEERAAEGSPVPFWPVWGGAPARDVLREAWRAALDLPGPGYRLTVAHVFWLEGASTPEVAWVRERVLRPGDPVDLRVVRRDVHPVFRKKLGLDWLGVRSPTLGGADPGTVVLELEGGLRIDGGGVVLDVERFDYDLFIGGPKDWWSVRRAGETLLAGRATPLAVREYGWPRHGTHTSVELIVAAIDPIASAEGVAAPERFRPLPFDPRSAEAWRARLAKELERDCAELVARAVPDPADPAGRRLPPLDPVDTWIGELPRVLRVSLANQWMLAALLPVPEAREALSRAAGALRSSGAFGALLDAEAPFPQCYEPGDAFERTIAQLGAARLAAGDPGPTAEEDVAALLADFPMTSAQWAHRVLDARGDAIRAFALARLDSKFTSDALWITLGREASQRGLHLPAWALERVDDAPANLLAEELRLAGPGTWTGLLLPLACLAFVALLARRRSPLSDRVGLAGCSLFLAFFSLGRTLQVGPVALALAPFAVLLAWAAVRTLQRAADGPQGGERYAFALALAASLAMAFGAGDGARTLLRAGVLLVLPCFPRLLTATLSTSGASSGAGVRWLGPLVHFVVLPLGFAQLLRAAWISLHGVDPLERLALALGAELDTLERVGTWLVYAPIGGVVLGVFLAALVWSHRLREREKLERAAGPMGDAEPADEAEALSPRADG